MHLHSSTHPLGLPAAAQLPCGYFPGTQSRIARTLQLHSSSQPSGLPAVAQLHGGDSPGTQYARPHFKASLFHSALGLASRCAASLRPLSGHSVPTLARILQLHFSPQPLGACQPQRSIAEATFRALSMLARTSQLRSSTQPLGAASQSAASLGRTPQARLQARTLQHSFFSTRANALP